MSNEKAIFEGTIFEGTEILWVDGKPHLVKMGNVKMSECKGAHYVDVISKQKYHVKVESYDNPWCELVGYRNVSNAIFSSVLDYMNGELLHQITSGNFTDMNAIDFINKVEKEGSKNK